jgi:nucleoside-diphosphate-sugar epimerase
MTARDIVTGAFGFTGGYIARRLLAMGRQVVTLTNHPSPAAGRMRLEDWLERHRDRVGAEYHCELSRHYRLE